MNNLIDECDWFTRDGKSNTVYYTKDSACFKQTNTSNKVLLNELDIRIEPNSSLDYNLQNNFSQNIKFSQNLSGKNVFIHGGGNIATIGSGNTEDIAVISGIVPKGIIYIEFYCPISCQNLSFGMVSIVNGSLPPSPDTSSFKSFRTTTPRTIGLEINYDKRIVSYYLNGIPKKEKTSEFNKECLFPAVFILSQSTAVVVNAFARQNNLDFPLYFSRNRNQKESQYLFTKFCFVTEIPKIKLEENFNKEDFLKSHFKFTYYASDNNPFEIKLLDSFLPIEENGSNTLKGILALVFDRNKDIQDFKNLNKDVKINNTQIKFLEKNQVQDILAKSLFNEINLEKLLEKSTNLIYLAYGNIDLSIFELNKSDIINKLISDNNHRLVAEWIVDNYENFYFDSTIALNITNLMREINEATSFFNEFCSNIHQKEYEKVGSPIDKNVKLEYLPHLDKLLLIQGAYLKLLSRNSSGNFDFDLICNKVNSGTNLLKVYIIFNVKELKEIIEIINWKQLILSNSDSTSFRAIYYFFNALRKVCKLSDNLVLLPIRTKQSKKIIEILLSHLNKMLFCTKEYSTLIESLKKKQSIDFDKEIDKSLPFAPEYEEEEKNEEDYKRVLNKFTIHNPEKFLLSLKGLLFAFEQIGILNGEIDKKKNTISHSLRWASAYSRLSTFVNYPFNSNNLISELANKGFYVTNALSSELCLYGNDSTKLVDFESVRDSEAIESLLNQQINNNIFNQSSLFSNIELSTTLNLFPPSVQLDHQTKEHLNVYKINYNKNIPYIVTSAENGNTIVWNCQYGLLASGNFNLKNAFKEVKDFKDILDLKWLKKDSNYQNISDIFNVENFEISKNEKVEKVNTSTATNSTTTAAKEKIVPNQEHMNNLYMMGFPLEASKVALIEKKNNFDQALEYLFEKSSDPEFMAKYQKKEVKEEKISPWECGECTYVNVKGDFSCEICGSSIPEKILKEYLNNQQLKKEENERLEKQRIIEQISKKENIIIENILSKYGFLKDCKILNIHLTFSPSDPVAPFLVVGILQDLVTNKIYVNTVKLMINPIIFKDYIKITKDGYYSNITHKRFNRFEECASHLIQKHSINLLTLYPTFVGKSNSDSFNVLIPIEQDISEIPAISYFDSICYEREGQSIILLLTEETQSNYTLFTVNLKNKYKFMNIGNKSLDVTFNRNTLEFLNDYPTELNLFRNQDSLYILDKRNVFIMNYDFTLNNTIPIAQNVGNFRKIEPNFNENNQLVSFNLLDDNNKIYELVVRNINQESENKNQSNNYEDVQRETELKLSDLNVEDLTDIELNSLSQLLDFEKIRIIQNPEALYPQRGIVNTKSLNPLTKKKVYIDFTRKIDNSGKIEFEIDLESSNVVILMNLEFLLTTKAIESSPVKRAIEPNPAKSLKYYNMILSMNEEITNLSNSLVNNIPIRVVNFSGAQSQKGVNIASIIYGVGTFASNYPRPEYVFAHAHNKSMLVESVIVGSVIHSKAGEAPLGEGLIYLLDSLDNIPMIRNATYNWKLANFENFLLEKEENGEEFYESDPVGYVILGKNEVVRTKIIKPRFCKYIYFKPTNTRTEPKDLSSYFSTSGIILTVFSAEGSVATNELSLENNTLMNEYTLKKLNAVKLSPVTNFEVKVLGLCGTNYFEFDNSQNIVLNKSISFSYMNGNSSFNNIFGSKFCVVNSFLQNNEFKRVKFEISGDDNMFNLQGVSVELQSFKSVESRNLDEFKNLQDINITGLRRVIIEKARFSVLNQKFCEYLTKKTDKTEKKILSLKYLKYLSEKIPNLKDNIIENIDLHAYFQYNILESGNSELINLSLDFLSLLKSESNKKIIEDVCVNLLDRLSTLRISSFGFKSFYKFIFIVNIDYNVLANSLLHNIQSCLKITKESNFQTDSYIYLKNFLKSDSSPFDTHLYYISKNDCKSELKQESSLNDNTNLIQSYILSEVIGDTMRFTIDMEKIHKLNSIKLEFGQCTETDDFNFRVSIWGSNPCSSFEDNFDILSSRFYLDHTWKQLTKHHKENVVLKGKEIRSILYRNLDYIGRYLCIEISINQGQFFSVEFPKFFIIPELYGDISNEISNYEYKKITEFLNSHISLSTQQMTINDNTYIIKKYLDPKLYFVNPDLSSNNVPSENTAKVDKPEIDINTIKNNLKTFQNSLEKIITELINKKESSDDLIKSKISTILDDIKNNQIKINSLETLVSINDSLSTNNQLLLHFIKSLKTISTKNSNCLVNAIKNLFKEDKEILEFTISLFESCVLNETGELASETLSFIKNYFWEHLSKETVSEFFDNIVIKYLTKDSSIRSPIMIIEAIAFVDIEIDLILQKLQESFSRNWEEHQIPDAFYNISSLIMLLIIKIKNKSKQISEKCKDIIQINLEFLKFLTTESKFSKEINDIIISHTLNLLYESFKSTTFETLNQIINPGLIEFMVHNLFQLWDNVDIKTKISSIIEKLIDPFSVLSLAKLKKFTKSTLTENNLISAKNLSDKITLNSQILTLKYLDELFKTNQSSEEINKLDYILNILNTSYQINSYLQVHTKDIACKNENTDIVLDIKNNNSCIIEKFITVIMNVNSGNKIGFSSSNNFWKYLSEILERGNIEMLFHNKIFSNLILKSFLNFKEDLQEYFLTKFIFVFKALYNKETINGTEIFDEIINVIFEMINISTNKPNELLVTQFLNQITDILVTNTTPFAEEAIVFNQFKCSPEMRHFLFVNVSSYIIQYLNIASFTGSISSSKIIFNRVKLAKNLLYLTSLFISDYLNEIGELKNTEEFRLAIRNYLIWIIFDHYAESNNQIPMITKVAKCWAIIWDFVLLCSKRKKLIEIMLSEFMKIIRKIDDQVFRAIKANKMCQKKGIIVTEKLLNTLENLIDKCLCDDEITKFFAFELEGFKFFIDRVNSHRQNLLLLPTSSKTDKKNNVQNYHLNNELLKSLTIEQVKSETGVPTKEEENVISAINLNELNYEEFALNNKLSLIEGDPNSPSATISNINWSTKKKPNAGHIYTREMKENGFFEETFFFSLPNLIEVKDIIIGFSFNVTNFNDKSSGIIKTVYLEAGQTIDKLDICIKLERMEDIPYMDKQVIAFGFNFFAYRPDNVKLDEDYLENILSQLINCRAKYFKFIVHRPSILCNDYSYNGVSKLLNDNVVIGINHVSISGLKLVNNQKVMEFIQEKEKEVSIKIISKIFTAEFIDTLKFIAKDSAIIDNIKQIYDAFEPYINQHASILSNILINVSKYNFELGEWLLNRLLSIDNSEIHAKLAIEISQNNEEFVNERLNKFLVFILRELNPNAPIFFASDVEKKLKNIGRFAYYFSVILNGLLTSPFQTKKIELNIDFKGLLTIIQNLQKYTTISNEIMKLICLLLIPNKKLLLNEFLDPEEAIVLINELYINTYISEYAEILSFLIASSEQFAKIAMKNRIFDYYCQEFLKQVNTGLRGRNMLSLMNIIKNMSYSKLFVKVVREFDYDFKIFDSIKNKNEKSDSILINNNIVFLNNFVVFMRNCIIDNIDSQKRLAEILINDLETCKKKIDKNYANNVLMPLLRMEKIVNLCIHPTDSFLKSVHSMFCNLSNVSSGAAEKIDHSKEEDILPSYILTNQVQKDVFKKFVKKHDFDGKKLNLNKFKLVYSTKTSLDKVNIYAAIAQSISGIGPFLIVTTGGGKKLGKKEKKDIDENEIITGFFCNSILPTLPSTLTGTDYQTLYIPYTHQNFLFQIVGNNSVFYKVKPDYDENTGKEYELGTLYYDSYSATLSVTGDIIYLSLVDPNASTVNAYPEVCQILQSNGLTDMKNTTVKDFEIFVPIHEEINEVVNTKDKRIISTKYIDDSGNLNFNAVKNMKYYKENHPLLVVRNNPVLEVPININVKILKEFIIHENIDMRILFTQEPLKNDTTLSYIDDFVSNLNLADNTNILDFSYDVSSIRGLIGKSELPLSSIPNYEPKLPVFESFESLDGIRKIVGVLKNSIQLWKSKDAIEKWIKWIEEVESFSELPSFFATLIRHSKCFDIIFNLLCGIYDNENSYKEVGVEASKYIYEILNTSFIANDSQELRMAAIEKGIFKNILDRLQMLTREKPRKYLPGDETEEKAIKKEEKTAGDKKKETVKSKKGIGYGSDQTGDNKSWDVNNYLENKKNNSEQINLIIKLLTNFFNSKNLKMNESFLRILHESSLLPVLESAFRSGSLLELVKEDFLYFSYLELVLKLSENKHLIPLILDISKDYKPVQNESVYKLLTSLNEIAKIFISCMKNTKAGEKSSEEKLAIEIEKIFKIIQENVSKYKTSIESDKNYMEILNLPVANSYPLLLRELSFDYMTMRDNGGKYVHYYSSSTSDNPSSTKLIRLAQEYANLSKSLPCEHTNAIYVRVDKDQMDLMKVIIMGSAGTPYAHGAFEYDVHFDSNYPQGPPKVNLMTTGAGQVRFNPNLYATGKVCLSLLGTWRGQSTENWDPKISTLLQVLLSIQSIIMSEYVYFNEPSCEGEIGKPEGEAKNEAYSNIVRYCNVKYSMIEQIKKPSKGFEEVIRRHFYLKKQMILDEVKTWIDRSKTATAKYTSFSYDHNPTWAQKFSNQETYTKMLEEIYNELETELNNLPLPGELKKKAEESERLALENQKKKEKNKNLIDNYINLDSVDVSYGDTNVNIKEIDINDEKVKDRWSRYIGAMGIEAVARQANSSVFLSGANGLGIEIAKNIVLSGCKRFVLHDSRKTEWTDLSSQFFLSEEDIGYNRAERCIKKLQELNFYVKILSSVVTIPKEETDLDKFGLKDFNIVILTQCDYLTAIAVNKYCRKRNIQFIYCDLYGVFGRVINDFGEEFVVLDQDGEELKENMLKSITNEKEGVVTVLEGTRHNFQDGDEIVITEVEGMWEFEDKDQMENEILSKEKSINKTQHKVTVINPHSFKIGDTSIYSKYLRNGIARQVKTAKKVKFRKLEDCLFEKELFLDENLAISDFTKMSHSKPIHLAYHTLDVYSSLNNDTPGLWNVKDCSKFMELANQVAEKFGYTLTESDIKLMTYFSFTNQTQFSPLAAFYGGFVAQEAIKAMTAKYSPINQVFYYGTPEVLPEIDINKLEESVSSLNLNFKKTRTDGLLAIVGNDILKKINEMKILMVGAGAIGCELLKNFAMLEVGTSEEPNNKGCIYVTDPDIIEVSNLNRQFLFREKHLRKPKSVTASAAAVYMNKNLKNHIHAYLEKICEQTEHIFTDKFISNLSLIANALDNIHARRYVDSRCVSNRIPLLESGTLGPKGHVQIVIPFKTESYSSQNDPEVTTDIPQCTLKMFPEEALHCIEWARDRFGKLFTQRPKNVNLLLEEGFENQELKILIKAVKTLKIYPKSFEDCLRIAREKFEKYFVNDIKQLLFAYPLDKLNKDGSKFWSLPKRPPVPLEFDPKDPLHISFIAAFTCLTAKIFRIKIPYETPRKDEPKEEMSLKSKEYKVPEFKPNELKAKEIEKEVEKEKKQKEEEEKKDTNNMEEDNKTPVVDIDTVVKEFNIVSENLGLKDFKSLNEKEKKEKELISEEFEKDNDDNFHIDLIYAMTNLRCRNYKLEELDWIKVKLKAGRIIPALATTTASIAGLQALELVKIAKQSEIEKIRNSFVNLAIPYFQSSEPGAVSTVSLKEGLKVNLWDRWEVKVDNNDNEKFNLGYVFNALKETYGLFPKDCFKGKSGVFMSALYENNQDEREKMMKTNLHKMLKCDEDDEYCDVTITFSLEEKGDIIKNTPIVRIIFTKN